MPNPIWLQGAEDNPRAQEVLNNAASSVMGKLGRLQGPWKEGGPLASLKYHHANNLERYRRLITPGFSGMGIEAPGAQLDPRTVLGPGNIYTESRGRAGAMSMRPEWSLDVARAKNIPLVGGREQILQTIEQQEGAITAGMRKTKTLRPWHTRGRASAEALMEMLGNDVHSRLVGLQYAPQTETLFATLQTGTRTTTAQFQMEIAGRMLSKPRAISVGGVFLRNPEGLGFKQRAMATRGVLVKPSAKDQPFIVMSAMEAALNRVEAARMSGGPDAPRTPYQISQLLKQELGAVATSTMGADSALHMTQMRMAELSPDGKIDYRKIQFEYPYEGRTARPDLITSGMKAHLKEVEGLSMQNMIYRGGKSARTIEGGSPVGPDFNDFNVSHQMVKAELLGSGREGWIMGSTRIGEVAAFGQMYDPARYAYQNYGASLLTPAAVQSLRKTGVKPGQLFMTQSELGQLNRTRFEAVDAHERALQAARSVVAGRMQMAEFYEQAGKAGTEGATELAQRIRDTVPADLAEEIRNANRVSPQDIHLRAQASVGFVTGLQRVRRGPGRVIETTGEVFQGPAVEALFSKLYKGQAGDVVINRYVADSLDRWVLNNINPADEDQHKALLEAAAFGGGRKRLGKIKSVRSQKPMKHKGVERVKQAINLYMRSIKGTVADTFEPLEPSSRVGFLFSAETYKLKFAGKDFGAAIEGELGELWQTIQERKGNKNVDPSRAMIQALTGTEWDEAAGSFISKNREIGSDVLKEIRDAYKGPEEQFGTHAQRMIAERIDAIRERAAKDLDIPIEELQPWHQAQQLGVIKIAGQEYMAHGAVPISLPFQFRQVTADELGSRAPLSTGLGFHPKGMPITEDLLRNLRSWGDPAAAGPKGTLAVGTAMSAIADYLENVVAPANPQNEMVRQLMLVEQTLMGGRIKNQGVLTDPLTEISRELTRGLPELAGLTGADRDIRARELVSGTEFSNRFALFGAQDRGRTVVEALQNSYWNPESKLFYEGATINLPKPIKLRGDKLAKILPEAGQGLTVGQLRLIPGMMLEKEIMTGGKEIWGNELLRSTEDVLGLYLRSKGGANIPDEEFADSIERYAVALNRHVAQHGESAMKPRLNFSAYMNVVGAPAFEEVRAMRAELKGLPEPDAKFAYRQLGEIAKSARARSIGGKYSPARPLRAFTSEMSVDYFLDLAGAPSGSRTSQLEWAERRGLVDLTWEQVKGKKELRRARTYALGVRYPEQGRSNIAPFAVELVNNTGTAENQLRISQLSLEMAYGDTDMDSFRLAFARNKQEAEMYRNAQMAVSRSFVGTGAYKNVSRYDDPISSMNVAAVAQRNIDRDPTKEVGALMHIYSRMREAPGELTSGWVDEAFLSKKTALKFMTGPFNYYAFGIAKDIAERRQEVSRFLQAAPGQMDAGIRAASDLIGAAYQIGSIKKAQAASTGFFASLEGVLAQGVVSNLDEFDQTLSRAGELRRQTALVLATQAFDDLGGAMPMMTDPKGKFTAKQRMFVANDELNSLWDNLQKIATSKSADDVAARNRVLDQMYDAFNRSSNSAVEDSLRLVVASEMLAMRSGGQHTKTALERFLKAADAETDVARATIADMWVSMRELPEGVGSTADLIQKRMMRRLALEDLAGEVEEGYFLREAASTPVVPPAAPAAMEPTMIQKVKNWFTDVPAGKHWQRAGVVLGAGVLGAAIVKNAFFPDIVPAPTEPMPSPAPHMGRSVQQGLLSGLPEVAYSGRGGTMPMVLPDYGEMKSAAPPGMMIGPQLRGEYMPPVSQAANRPGVPMPKMNYSESTAAKAMGREDHVNPAARVSLPMQPSQHGRTRPVPIVGEGFDVSVTESDYNHNMQELEAFVQMNDSRLVHDYQLSSSARNWDARSRNGSIDMRDPQLML